jgi:Zn-dependent peptidase ImmA (M78 family)
MKKSVTIFGKQIKIVRKKGLLRDSQAYGEYHPDDLTIYIDADLPPSTAMESLIHECGHAMFHRAGLSQSKIAADLEEIIVEQFAIMFAENFLPKRKASSGLKKAKK